MDQMNQTNDVQENPELKQLDMIIEKVKSGKFDPEELLMDLEDFKSVLSGDDTSMLEEPSGGMAGMIDKISNGGQK